MQIKRKSTNFPPLRSFYAQKIVTFVVFCSLNSILLVDFGLTCIFVHTKNFCKKKKKNCFEIVLIASSTILLGRNQKSPYVAQYYQSVNNAV